MLQNDSHSASVPGHLFLLQQKINFEVISLNFNAFFCFCWIYVYFCVMVAEWQGSKVAIVQLTEDLSPSTGRLLHILPPKCNIPNLPQLNFSFTSQLLLAVSILPSLGCSLRRSRSTILSPMEPLGSISFAPKGTFKFNLVFCKQKVIQFGIAAEHWCIYS